MLFFHISLVSVFFPVPTSCNLHISQQNPAKPSNKQAGNFRDWAAVLSRRGASKLLCFLPPPSKSPWQFCRSWYFCSPCITSNFSSLPLPVICRPAYCTDLKYRRHVKLKSVPLQQILHAIATFFMFIFEGIPHIKNMKQYYFIMLIKSYCNRGWPECKRNWLQ